MAKFPDDSRGQVYFIHLLFPDGIVVYQPCVLQFHLSLGFAKIVSQKLSQWEVAAGFSRAGTVSDVVIPPC